MSILFKLFLSPILFDRLSQAKELVLTGQVYYFYKGHNSMFFVFYCVHSSDEVR